MEPPVMDLSLAEAQRIDLEDCLGVYLEPVAGLAPAPPPVRKARNPAELMLDSRTFRLQPMLRRQKSMCQYLPNLKFKSGRSASLPFEKSGQKQFVCVRAPLSMQS